MVFSRNFFSFFLAIFAIFYLTSCSDPEKKAMEHFDKGEQYFTEEKYHEAIIEYRNVIKVLPKHAQARYKLGLAYVETDKPNFAFKELQRAASLDPENTDANLKVADIYLISGQGKEAKPFIESVLSNNPDNPEALLRLARVMLLEGERDKAVTILKSLIEANRDMAEGWQLLASAFMMEKEYEQAEATLLEAIAMEGGKKIDLYKALVSLYARTGQQQEKERVLQNMVSLFPESTEAKLGLALSQIREKKYADAEKTIETLLLQDPANEQVYTFASNFFRHTEQLERAEEVLKIGRNEVANKERVTALLADFYFETQRFSESQQLLNELFTNEPDNSRGRLIQAKLLLKDGKLEEAAKTVEAVIDERPKWSDAYVVHSIVLGERNLAKLARQSAEKAVQLNPNNPKANHQLALRLLTENDHIGARLAALRTISLQPDNWQAFLTLARAQAGEKEYRNSIKILNELAERKTNNIEILLLRANCHLALAELDAATRDYQKVMEINPQSTPALARLADIEKQNNGFASGRKLIEAQIASNNYPGHMFLLASYLVKGGKPEEAVTILEKLQSLRPDFTSAYNLLARIYLSQKDHASAMNQHRALLNIEPQNIGTMMNLAILEGKHGDSLKAKELYEKILELKPDFAPAANSLAMHYAKDESDLALALHYAQKALDNAPDDPFIADTVGWIHYKRGSYSLALAELKRAKELLPNNEEVQKHYALAEEAYQREKRQGEADPQQAGDFGSSLSIGGDIDAKDMQ